MGEFSADKYSRVIHGWAYTRVGLCLEVRNINVFTLDNILYIIKRETCLGLCQASLIKFVDALAL